MPYIATNQASSTASEGNWHDSMSAMPNFPTTSASPSRSAFTAHIFGWAYALNDEFDGAIQFDHDCVPGSTLNCHIHFAFASQPTEASKLQFEVYYSYAKIDGTFSETGPVYYEYVVQAADAKVHRVRTLFSITADATSPQSGAVAVHVKRVAKSAGGVECDVNPHIFFCDSHYQSRTAGGTLAELGP